MVQSNRPVDVTSFGTGGDDSGGHRGAGCKDLLSLSVFSAEVKRREWHCDRVEGTMESVDADWCDGVSRCSRDEIDRLSGLLVSVQALSSSSGVSEACAAVTDLLECLDRCASIVVQSVSVVCAGAAEGRCVVSALVSLRALSEERLDTVCADEAAAFDVVRRHVCSLDVCIGDEFVSGAMALHTLGCRNGTGVCGRAEVAEEASGLFTRWYECASGGGDVHVAGAACGALCLVTWYAGQVALSRVGLWITLCGYSLNVVRSRHGSQEAEAPAACGQHEGWHIGNEDLSLACGWGAVIAMGHVSEHSDSGQRRRYLQQRTGPVPPCGAITTACFMVGGDMLRDGRHKPFDVFMGRFR